MNGAEQRAPAPAKICQARLSRYCHGSRGKILENGEQKMNTEEKFALALHRNLLILLGKPPLRQIISKSLQWLLTEGLLVRI